MRKLANEDHREVVDIINQNNYISKLRKHNEKALEYIVREYGGCVKAAIYKNLAGMPEEMEECMDDVFLDAWNNIDRFDGKKGSFKSWITAIARFRSIDYLRRYSRRCAEEDIDDHERELARDNLMEMLDEEISDGMEKLLKGLTDDDRDIILRYYWDEQDVARIADDYGVTSSTIYSRMSRARNKLKVYAEVVNKHEG